MGNEISSPNSDAKVDDKNTSETTPIIAKSANISVQSNCTCDSHMIEYDEKVRESNRMIFDKTLNKCITYCAPNKDLILNAANQLWCLLCEHKCHCVVTNIANGESKTITEPNKISHWINVSIDGPWGSYNEISKQGDKDGTIYNGKIILSTNLFLSVFIRSTFKKPLVSVNIWFGAFIPNIE